jgi:hypothetical protein
VEVLDKIKVDRGQLEEVMGQLKKLSEMDVCLSSWAIACYQIMWVPVDEKTTISYWIRVIEDEDGYTIEILKEELYG